VKFAILAMALFWAGSSHAQNLPFVKSLVAQLSDSSFYGRGYVMEGSHRAADYLISVFDSLGLEKIGDGTQTFDMRVNTFPGKMYLRCDKTNLIPGHDFLVDPRSKSIYGKFAIVRYDSSRFQSRAQFHPKITQAPLIDLQGMDTPEERDFLYDFEADFGRQAPIFELQPKKLMWSVAREQGNNTVVEIAANSVCRKAKRISIDVEAQEVEVQERNIVRKIAGRRSDSILVVTAHYDHLGMMGPAIFPGGSDNATGTAMMVDLARHYTLMVPEFDMVFIAFAAEEAGLVGSKYFVDHPVIDLEKIKFLINLDLMGSASKGVIVVNGLLFPERMKQMSTINDSLDLVPRIKHRGKAANSDHYWFSEAGVPAVFIYTEGEITAYHDVHDTAAGIDWTRYPEVFTLLVEFIANL